MYPAIKRMHEWLADRGEGSKPVRFTRWQYSADHKFRWRNQESVFTWEVLLQEHDDFSDTFIDVAVFQNYQELFEKRPELKGRVAGDVI